MARHHIRNGNSMNIQAKERPGNRYSAVVHLSALLGRPLFSPTNESVGKVDDVIVGLRGEDYPLVTGLVAKVGGRRVFVPMERVAELSEQRIVLAKSKVDLRGFERRDGEVLLREDILGHRLIDVADAVLVRAWDVELRATDEGWAVSCLDTRRPPRLFGLIRSSAGRPCQDWKAFEPLIGHTPSVRARATFGRVVRLKPAQIADLLEDASHTEGEEILDVVHSDPELEADVFEELGPWTSPTDCSATRRTPRWPTWSPTCAPTMLPMPSPSSPRRAASESLTFFPPAQGQKCSRSWASMPPVPGGSWALTS